MPALSLYARTLMIPLHLLFAAGICLLPWHWYDLAIGFLAWMVIGAVGVEIGLHRLFSHRAFSCSQTMSRIIAVIGCYGAQWSPIWWVALHQGYHHPHADGESDPHSPNKGLWHAFMGWYFTVDPNEINLKAAKRLLTDPFQLALHRHYLWVFWTPIVLLGLCDAELCLWMFIIPALLSFHQENLVNLFCHLPRWGYRNHDISDESCNNLLLGWFAWGAGYHNNHHAKPHTYSFGERWFEPDVCGILVPAILTVDRALFQ
jgi:stearoyl-CoA desaturase (delta-9 desaturase)